MPTKLEQVAAIMATMTPLELESAKAIAQGYIDSVPATTDCKFLDLPAELRNHIYTYTSIAHLRECRKSGPCGLLTVNKQIRHEFADVFYSDKVSRIKVLSVKMNKQISECLDTQWTVLPTGSKLIEAVLNHANLALECDCEAFSQEMHSAEFRVQNDIEWDAFATDQSDTEPSIFGVIELFDGDEVRLQAFALELKKIKPEDLDEEMARVIPEPLHIYYPWCSRPSV